MKELNGFVLIGEYDCFCGFDIVINGHSLNDTQRKEMEKKICLTDYSEYGKLFQMLFPGKIVIYNCDGSYWYYKNGERFDFEEMETIEI